MTNEANLGVEQQRALADLYNTYAKNKLSLDQYLYEAGQNAYDKAYANSYQAQQDAIANALQQQYYNYLMSSRSYGGGGGSYSGGGETALSNGGDWFTNNLGSYENARSMGRERVASILESGLAGGYITQSQAEDIIRRIGFSNPSGGTGARGGGGSAGGR